MMTSDDDRKAAPAKGDTAGRPRIDRTAQLRLGEELRNMYDDIVKQGVPDRFAELLSKLDARTEAEKIEDK